MKESFSVRLQKGLDYAGLKAINLHEMTKISESLISKYLSGKAFARQKNISIIANALDISEAWLMGYDVPMKKEISNVNSTNYYDIEAYKFVIDLYNSLTNENKMNAISYMRALSLMMNKPSKPKVQILGQTAAGKPLEYGDTYAQDIDDVEDVPKGADYALVVNRRLNGTNN